MGKRSLGRAFRAAFVMLGIAACTSEPTAHQPLPTRSSPDLVGDLVAMHALERATPLSSDIVASAVIGSAGGTISIPQAGVTLTIPAGAVASPVAFSLKAVAGNLVAYELEPHGTSFLRNVEVRQDLTVTQWNGTLLPLLKAGYFADLSQLQQGSATALVSEVLGGLTSLLSGTFTWRVEHFSGYVVAW